MESDRSDPSSCHPTGRKEYQRRAGEVSVQRQSSMQHVTESRSRYFGRLYRAETREGPRTREAPPCPRDDMMTGDTTGFSAVAQEVTSTVPTMSRTRSRPFHHRIIELQHHPCRPAPVERPSACSTTSTFVLGRSFVRTPYSLNKERLATFIRFSISSTSSFP